MINIQSEAGREKEWPSAISAAVIAGGDDGRWKQITRTCSDLSAAAIPHTFSAAVSYDIPRPGSAVLKQISGSWSTDSIIYARSAPPVTVVTGNNPFSGTLLFGSNSVQRSDVVPGVPFYLHPAGAPGGKVLQRGGLHRSGHGTRKPGTQWNITLRRR